MKPDEKLKHERMKEAVQEAYDNIEVPDMEGAWENIQKRLKVMKRRSRILTTLKLGAAIACVSLIIGVISTPNDSFAFRNLFSMVKKDDQEGWIHVLFGETSPVDNTGAKTAPPPDFAEETGNTNANEFFNSLSKPEEVTLEQAQEKLAFPMHILTTIPEDYHLTRTMILPDTKGRYRTVRVEYENENGALFVMSQKQLNSNSSGLKTSINESLGRIKDVYINGQRGVLTMYTNGGTRIEWLADHVVIELYGDLTEDEMLVIAKQVKIKRE